MPDMGADAARDQPGPSAAADERPLTAFDFDGTLTVRDAGLAFMAWRAGPWRFALGLLRLAPDLAAYLVRRDRGALKAATARIFLAGTTAAEIGEDAERFAAHAFDRLMRPDALRCWAGHGEAGRERVIVTASAELVIAPFARRLGADRLIGTRLALDGGGRLTGGLDGPNCRGEEKVVRLEQAYGPDLRLYAAYGDTIGDREMLAIAERPGYRVFKARPTPAAGKAPRRAGAGGATS